MRYSAISSFDIYVKNNMREYLQASTITRKDLYMEQWQIEKLHQEGKMPDWFYYQQVKKPIMVSLFEQKQDFIDELNQKKEQEQFQIDLEKQVSEIIESLIEELNRS